MVKVTVLLPTLNEELAIVKTIQEINEYFPGTSIVVIDGLSTDRTVELAEQFGNVHVVLVRESGKGIAVRRTIGRIASKYVVMMDADFTYPAKYILEVVNCLEDGFDVVLGYRHKRQAGSMSWVNVAGNRALSALTSITYGKTVKDVCTGLWGFHKGVLDKFRLTSSGFTLEADLWKNTVKNGCRVKQIPIEYRARLEHSKTKLNIGHGFEIAKFILSNR